MVLLFVNSICLIILLIVGGSPCVQDVGSGWLGFAWQEISWLGFVLSDFENGMILRDLTMVRFQSRFVMILSIIILTKTYLKTALQFVNWVYSASTHLSFSSKEKLEIPFQKAIESQRNVTLPRKHDRRIPCERRSLGLVLL